MASILSFFACLRCLRKWAALGYDSPSLLNRPDGPRIACVFSGSSAMSLNPSVIYVWVEAEELPSWEYSALMWHVGRILWLYAICSAVCSIFK